MANGLKKTIFYKDVTKICHFLVKVVVTWTGVTRVLETWPELVFKVSNYVEKIEGWVAFFLIKIGMTQEPDITFI